MAEKSFVNDETAMFGAGEELLLLLLLLDAPLLLDVDELDDDEPHAAMPTVAASTSAALTGLLFSKCTMTSSSFSPWDQRRRGAAQRLVSRSAAVTLIESDTTP
jgi:hypothetical protein